MDRFLKIAALGAWCLLADGLCAQPGPGWDALVAQPSQAGAIGQAHRLLSRERERGIYCLLLAQTHQAQLRQVPLSQPAQWRQADDSTHYYYARSLNELTRRGFQRHRTEYERLLAANLTNEAAASAAIRGQSARLRAYEDTARRLMGYLQQVRQLYARNCQLYDRFVKGAKQETGLFLRPDRNRLDLLDSLRQNFAQVDRLRASYQALGQGPMWAAQKTRLRFLPYKGDLLGVGADCQPVTLSPSEMVYLDFRQAVEHIRYKIYVQVPALKSGFAVADQALSQALERYYAPASAQRKDLFAYNSERERQIADTLRVFDPQSLAATLIHYKIAKLEALHAVYLYRQRGRPTPLTQNLPEQSQAEARIVTRLAKCDSLLRNINLQPDYLEKYADLVGQRYQGRTGIEQFIILERQSLQGLLDGWRVKQAATDQQLALQSRFATYGKQRIVLYHQPAEFEALLRGGNLVSLYTHPLPNGELMAAGYYLPPGSEQDRMAFVARVDTQKQARWVNLAPGEPPHGLADLRLVLDGQGWACLTVWLKNPQAKPQALLIAPNGQTILGKGLPQVAALAHNAQSATFLTAHDTPKPRVKLSNAAGQTLHELTLDLKGQVIAAVPDGPGYCLVANYIEYADQMGRLNESDAFRVNGTNVVLVRLNAQGQITEYVPYNSRNTLLATDLFYSGNGQWVLKGRQAADPKVVPTRQTGEPWAATFQTK
ncbi:MAG: hypothetical protein MUC97_00760 [Bernardetiaceae bacterium]|jgi:hypothetical protein|nr:hypothetical protein [Bernardetiaceae bacterium]